MKITIRPEEGKDQRRVEEITREAFWNLYVPGATEHYVVHAMRTSQVFIKNLDFVAEADQVLAGNIVYSHSIIKDNYDVEHKVITFGPVSVLPQYQGKGIGSALIQHTLKLAANMGFAAVVIYGDPEYYQRFGFKNCKEFNVSAHDGKFMKALQVLELKEGALDSIGGRFFEGSIFEPNETQFKEFDKTFPKKELKETESQKRFALISTATVS